MLARGAVDIANNQWEERRKEGKKILAEIKEIDYIRSMRWRYVPLPAAADLDLSLN